MVWGVPKIIGLQHMAIPQNSKKKFYFKYLLFTDSPDTSFSRKKQFITSLNPFFQNATLVVSEWVC